MTPPVCHISGVLPDDGGRCGCDGIIVLPPDFVCLIDPVAAR
jgi:hypothetical protein